MTGNILFVLRDFSSFFFVGRNGWKMVPAHQIQGLQENFDSSSHLLNVYTLRAGGGVSTSHLLQSPPRQKPRLPPIYRWGSWGTDTYFAQLYTQLSLVRFWLQPRPSWIQIIYIWEVTWPFTPRDYGEKERLGLCSLIGICFYIALVGMSSVLIYRGVKELERNSEWVECISALCSSGLHSVLGHYMDTVVSPKSRLVFLITYPEAVPLGQGAHRVVVMADACAGAGGGRVCKSSHPGHCHAWHRRASQRTRTSQERDHLVSWPKERIVNQEKIIIASSFKNFLRLVLFKNFILHWSIVHGIARVRRSSATKQQ